MEFFEIKHAQKLLLKDYKNLWRLQEYVQYKTKKSRLPLRTRTKIKEFLHEVVTPDFTDTLKRMPYRTYLATAYWQLIRLLVLGRDKSLCSVCQGTEKLQVHHLTYIHRGQEFDWLGDLTVVCERCHQTLHDNPDGYGVAVWTEARKEEGQCCTHCKEIKPKAQFIWCRKNSNYCRQCHREERQKAKTLTN